MNILAQIKGYLEVRIEYRERSNKNKFIARLLQKKYPFELESISLQRLEDIVVDCSTFDRAWRKCLEENPSLQGHDYSEKAVLEQKKQIDLGYSPGYQQDIKTLALIGS